MTADAIIEWLRRLDGAGLERVHTHVQALRALTKAPRGQASEAHAALVQGDEAYLYEALCKHMQRALKIKYAPFRVFQQTAPYKPYAVAAKLVFEWNAGWFPEQTKRQRYSMLSLYADLVVRYMVDHGWTMYWQSASKALTLLPAIVDRQFPGYIRSGLLSTVQTLRTKGNSEQQETDRDQEALHDAKC